jgi:ABC-type sulfate/molybdate transport systems ATPase subunit
MTAMFQQPHLFTHLSVLDNVAFGPRIRGASRREGRDIARRYLALVHLQDVGQRRTRQLSGGQQQRVALARALATERQVLLLDEPFSALDAGLRRSMHDLLREVRAALAPTIVMVTHDLDEASLADRVTVLADGRLQQVGTVTSLYRRPASVVVASLLGGFNEIPGHSDGVRHVSAWGPVDLPPACPVRGPGILLVRREQLLLEPVAAGDSGRIGLADDGVAVRVAALTGAGPRQVAVVERPHGRSAGKMAPARLEVELPLGKEVVPGQVLTLRLDPAHAVWAVADRGDTPDVRVHAPA